VSHIDFVFDKGGVIKGYAKIENEFTVHTPFRLSNRHQERSLHARILSFNSGCISKCQGKFQKF
jgi:hypothetical protein